MTRQIPLAEKSETLQSADGERARLGAGSGSLVVGVGDTLWKNLALVLTSKVLGRWSRRTGEQESSR